MPENTYTLDDGSQVQVRDYVREPETLEDRELRFDIPPSLPTWEDQMDAVQDQQRLPR